MNYANKDLRSKAIKVPFPEGHFDEHAILVFQPGPSPETSNHSYSNHSYLDEVMSGTPPVTFMRGNNGGSNNQPAGDKPEAGAAARRTAK